MRLSERIYLKIYDHITRKKLLRKIKQLERQVKHCFDYRITSYDSLPNHMRGESIENGQNITFDNLENSIISLRCPDVTLVTPRNTATNTIIRLDEISTFSKRASTKDRRDDSSVDAKYFDDDELFNGHYKYSMVVPLS